MARVVDVLDLGLMSSEEFAFVIRNKFGVNDNLPDEILVSAFIEKYPMYSCKIKKDIKQGGSCC